MEPAHTKSPVESIARQVNCVGLGVFITRKHRYLTKSKARTVPSLEQVRTALPLLGRNLRSVMAAVCSVKVTKQRQLRSVQSFSLPSSPPVASIEPSGE